MKKESFSQAEFSVIGKAAAVLVLLFLTGSSVLAQNKYAVASGDWSSTATWSSESGGTPGAPAPVAGDNVYIEGGYTVTLDASTASLNLLDIASGSTFITSGSFTVSVDYTSGTNTINISGTYNNGSDGAITAPGGITVNGTYIHTTSSTALPTATWSTGSTCEVTGWTSTAALTSSFNQSFYNFTWNCASQTANLSFAGYVTPVTGTFTLANTGTGYIYPAVSPIYEYYTQTGGTYNLTRGSTAEKTMTIGSDFLISGGLFYQSMYARSDLIVNGDLTQNTGSNYYITTTGSTVDVTGNFTMNGGDFNLAPDGTSCTLTVGGRFAMTNNSATFTMSAGTGIGYLYVAGDFTHTGGLIRERATGSGNIIFNGTGTQLYTRGYNLQGTINFVVGDGSNLPLLQMGTGANPAIISSASEGAFTILDGATLGVTSPDGITSSGASGNIQLTGTRTYSAGANYIYNGTAAQVTGTGLAQNTPGDLTINNSAGVTLSEETTISGSLTMTSGILGTGSNTLIMSNNASGAITGASASTYINGTLRRNIAAGANTYLFPIGTSATYAPVSLAFAESTLEGYLNASTDDGDHANIGESKFSSDETVNRTWSLSVSSGLGTVLCDATFNWVPGDEDPGFDYATAIAGKYDAGWTYPAVGSTAETSIQVTGLTSFSDFQAGNTTYADEPTVQASSISFTDITVGGMTINWTNGDGTSRVVLVRSGSAVDSDPVDGNSYAASTIFGEGDQLGTGNYVVYSGTGSSVAITGLSPNTTYHVAVYEFNGSGGNENYLLPGAAGNATTEILYQYRSYMSGNWSAATTWEFSPDGTNWASATQPPTYADDQITIQNAHTVTVTEGVTVDQVSVNSGGQVTVASGITLVIADGTGDDLIVNGVVDNTGTITSSGTIAVNNGGTYIHSTSGTSLPTATWNTGSTCEITGWTGTASLTSSFDQSFYNFTWNCASQASDVSFAGYVTSVTGTFTLEASGGYSISPAGSPAYANYLQTGGIYDVSDDTNERTIYISGNFSHTGGDLTETGSASGTVIFNGTGTQTFTTGGTLSGTINFIVGEGANLPVLQMGTGASPAVISSGSDGSFTILEGATLGVTSPDGITITATGAAGNIQVTGVRTYTAGVNYIYNGTSAQVTGDGLAQNIPADLNINNIAGVTLTGETTISGVLTLTDGVLNTNANTLVLSNNAIASVTGGSEESYINGNLRRNIAAGENTYSYPVGTLTVYAPVSLAFGTATTTGYLSGSTADGDHTGIGTSEIDPASSVNRTWSFSVAGGLETIDCDATFNWVSGDADGGFNYNTSIAGRYDAAWTYPVPGTVNETNMLVPGLTGFGDFQIGNVIEPTVQATAVVFSNVASTGMTIGWTNGNGARRIVLVRAGSAVDNDPADLTSYTANTVFGDGSELGTGNFVVYNSSGSSVNITGLAPGVTYYVAVYEFNGTGGHENYLITSPATGSQTTLNLYDYRSAGDGDWNAPATWEIFNGSDWIPASESPTSADASITILGTHTVTVTENVTVDEVTVASGGQVTLASGITLTIADGSGDDFAVNGILENAGGTFTTTGTLTINNGGRYLHSTSGTTLPTATWNTGSTCEITGWTGTTALTSSFDQDFYNFTWNCAGQTAAVSFAGYVTPVTGTFTLANTGTGYIYPATSPVYEYYTQTGGTYNLTRGSSEEKTMTVGSDFLMAEGLFYQSMYARADLIVQGDFTQEIGSNYYFTTTGSTADITGNFTMTGGEFNLAPDGTSCTLTVGGRFAMTHNSAIFTMSAGTGIGYLYVAGDFTHTGGLIRERATGSGTIIFNGTGTQLYTRGYNLSGTINFVVGDGSNLPLLQMGTGADPAVISSSSEGAFTILDGATLGVTSPAGITVSGATGNIQLTGTRTYSAGANYIYNGTAAQVTGDGLPATVNSLEFNNTGGTVTFTSACTVTNNLSITTGSKASLGTFTTHTAGTLTLGGNLQPGCSYGSSVSGADFKNDTYFDNTATGIVTTGTCPAGTWLGGTSGDWSTSSNWTGGTIPSSSTDVVVSSAAPNQPVILASTTAECNDMTVNAGASFTINAGQALTINGDLSNSGTFTIQSSSVTSSGSLIVNGTSTGLVTYNRQLRTQADAGDYHYFSSPVAGQVISGFVADNVFGEPAASKVTGVWDWDETIGDWPDLTASGTSFVPGKGYNLAQNTDVANDGNFAFTGTINGVVNITGTAPYDDPSYTQVRDEWGGGGWNMLGNPFTSAINGVAFVTANFDSFDASYRAVYIYSGDEGTRGIYRYIADPAPGQAFGGTAGTNFIQAGQGFFVLAYNNGVNFSFTPGTSGMQTQHEVAVEMTKSGKIKTSWPGLQLKVKYGKNESLTTVVFNKEMTAGLDPGYDVGQLSTGPEVEIYTTLVEDNGVNFARQALPVSECQKNIVAVGIDSENGGEVIFSAANVVPVNNGRYLLEDRLTHIFTDLSRKTYKVILPAKTYGTGRFYLHTLPGSRRGDKPMADYPHMLSLRVWGSGDNVIIQGTVSENAVVMIYNIYGHKILEKRLTDQYYNTVTVPDARGVYIVKVVDSGKVYTAKVMLL